jgi:hypothetical protein
MTNADDLLLAAREAPEKGEADLQELLGPMSTLRAKGYSWRDISLWFAERGIHVDHARLYRAFTRHLSAAASVPAADRYAEALRAVKMNPTQRAMLEHHFKAPNRTVTYTQLAKAAGKDDYQAANKQYGDLGAAIGKYIGFEFPMAPRRGKPFYSGAIGIDAPRSASNEYRLMMHHELAKAIEALALFPERQNLFPNHRGEH